MSPADASRGNRTPHPKYRFGASDVFDAEMIRRDRTCPKFARL
jgi:hypothetical protein